MEESRELNAVIDVIMLAGTILLKSGSEIHRVEDTMIRIAPVSYTHLTLPTKAWCRSRWSPYH